MSLGFQIVNPRSSTPTFRWGKRGRKFFPRTWLVSLSTRTGKLRSKRILLFPKGSRRRLRLRWQFFIIRLDWRLRSISWDTGSIFFLFRSSLFQLIFGHFLEVLANCLLLHGTWSTQLGFNSVTINGRLVTIALICISGIGRLVDILIAFPAMLLQGVNAIICNRSG